MNHDEEYFYSFFCFFVFFLNTFLSMFGLEEKALHALTVCQRLNITQNIGLTQNSVYQPIKHFFQGQTAIVGLMTYRQTLWHLPVLLRAMPEIEPVMWSVTQHIGAVESPIYSYLLSCMSCIGGL